MTRRTGFSSACATLFVGGIVGSSFAAVPQASTKAAAPQTTIYTLNQEVSTYQDGCFDPCLCPPGNQASISGTFGLTLVDSGPVFTTYDVTQVNWNVPVGDSNIHITGSGTYQVGGEVAIMHRLELDPKAGDLDVEHFDSGWVSGGNNFPSIDITISINGIFCFDQVIAMASGPADVIKYALQPGSTFQQGCFDPCDCPISEEMPMNGTFKLVQTVNYGTYREYDGLDVVWQAGPGIAVLHTLKGSGTYIVIDGFAGPMHQLKLALSVDGGPTQIFNSGLLNTDEAKPTIDIIVSINGMYCYDTVLHVIAEPVN